MWLTFIPLEILTAERMANHEDEDVWANIKHKMDYDADKSEEDHKYKARIQWRIEQEHQDSTIQDNPLQERARDWGTLA